MKSNRDKSKRKQSSLSRALASSNKTEIVQDRYFKNLTPTEIRNSVVGLRSHRHFAAAIFLNKDGVDNFYKFRTPRMSLEKVLAWCLGILEVHRVELQYFLDKQGQLLNFILDDQFDNALTIEADLESKVGLSVWGISLRGTLLALKGGDARREYLGKMLASAKGNSFFRAMCDNVINKFDDPETLQSESRFFELKIKRTFVGGMLHFLMYKLVPYNLAFQYDFESILSYEKNSSPVDILRCIMEFLAANVGGSDEIMDRLLRRTVQDLNKLFISDNLRDLAVAYGIEKPTPIAAVELRIIDLYTAGSYENVCEEMERHRTLWLHFGLVEVWAKALARSSNHAIAMLPRFLLPLKDVVTKAAGYEKSRAILLAYCHALSMFSWFKELRYLLERETRFYGAQTNEKLREASLLLSSLTTPAKAQVLAAKGYLRIDEVGELISPDSVTARLFARMRALNDQEPTPAELVGIAYDRQLKFRAAWHLAQRRYETGIPLLQELLKSTDPRAAQDASRSLVEAYRNAGDIEQAADVYATAVLNNINLLSAFDSAGLGRACVDLISSSKSISIPIVFSIYSRHIEGETFNAALKYSFECFLRNNGIENPIDAISLRQFRTHDLHYFLRFICTPEVMKLYLYFDSPKEIEQCRIEICKYLLAKNERDEELIFEIKERTRRLVLREAVSQVQGSRIFSDANLLTGPSSIAFKALFERFVALRAINSTPSADEEAFNSLIALLESKGLLKNLHTLYIQDVVLNEKNAVFLKLIKLVRDEFAFGEKGLNVYLSTRIRHGHFPNTIRKPLIENGLLAAKATDTAGYKLKKDWQKSLGAEPRFASVLEQSIVDFSIKFNDLLEEVNDRWLRIYTIDQDISGLSKDGELDKSLFNYSVSAIEAYVLQREINASTTYTDLVVILTKWLWDRTEKNLDKIRHRINVDMRGKAFSMLDEMSKATIHKLGIEALGHFPDAVVRARNGLALAFDTIVGWFTRARVTAIKEFDLEIAVQIASMAADASVEFEDRSGLKWNGAFLNPTVDMLYILFENCMSKSNLTPTDLEIRASADIVDGCLVIGVENRCLAVEDLHEANLALDKYRLDRAGFASAMGAAQGEGGSGFFKIWRLLDKDMNLKHKVSLGYCSPESFRVEIEVPMPELSKVTYDQNIVD